MWKVILHFNQEFINKHSSWPHRFKVHLSPFRKKDPVIPAEKLFFGHASLGHFTNETWLSTFHPHQVYKDSFIKPLQARTGLSESALKSELFCFTALSARTAGTWHRDNKTLVSWVINMHQASKLTLNTEHQKLIMWCIIYFFILLFFVIHLSLTHPVLEQRAAVGAPGEQWGYFSDTLLVGGC